MKKSTQELLNKIAKREEKGIKSTIEVIKENSHKVQIIETGTPRFSQTVKVKGSGDYWQKVYRSR